MKYPREILDALKAYEKAKDKLVSAHESLIEEIQRVSDAFSEHADSLESDDVDSDTQSEIEELRGEGDLWTDYINSLPELDFSDEPAYPELKP